MCTGEGGFSDTEGREDEAHDNHVTVGVLTILARSQYSLALKDGWVLKLEKSNQTYLLMGQSKNTQQPYRSMSFLVWNHKKKKKRENSIN